MPMYLHSLVVMIVSCLRAPWLRHLKGSRNRVSGFLSPVGAVPYPAYGKEPAVLSTAISGGLLAAVGWMRSALVARGQGARGSESASKGLGRLAGRVVGVGILSAHRASERADESQASQDVKGKSLMRYISQKHCATAQLMLWNLFKILLDRIWILCYNAKRTKRTFRIFSKCPKYDDIVRYSRK